MKDGYIGLMVEDTNALLIGLLAILKSGNCLVPINPAFPFDRLCFIIEDCRVRVLLTDGVNYARARQAAQTCTSLEHVICIDDIDFKKEIPGGSGEITDSAPRASRRHPCYVIYTSGSTGKPKGVPITSTNLIPLLLWFHDYFKLGPHTRVLQNLSYTFDFGFFELVTTLLTGGALYFFNKQALSNIDEYVDFIYRHQLNTIHTTPSFFTNIIGLGRELSPVKLLHFGGERLTGKIVREVSRQVSEHCYIYNGYGPTETTINSAIFSIRVDVPGKVRVPDSIPIGKPSANNIIYILDANRNFQPVGVIGELYIGGGSVSMGYINRPELTAERFDRDLRDWRDYHDGFYRSHRSHRSYIYRTGDLARWLSDGNIEFLGRIDHQVKIRGFRIEPGEIESQLLKCKGITDAVVIDLDKKPDGKSSFWGGGEDKYLCAYIVSKHHYDGAPARELREELARHLPDYMVPGYFVILDRIPLTPNGKVDRRALPLPEITVGRDYTAPRNEMEKAMVETWSQLLGVDPDHIGIDDNFFELGGHSLKVTSLMGHIHRLFDVEISFSELFKAPTIRAICYYIKEASRRIHRPIQLNEDREYYPLTPTQKRFYVFQQLEPANMSYNMPEIMLMEGELAREKFEKAFKQLLLRHESLRTSFHLVGGEPVQRIHEPEKVEFVLEYYDLTGKGPVDSSLPSPLKAEDITANFVRPFNLNRAPLWRAGLVKTGPGAHYFMFDMHHIISDGVSTGIFIRDFLFIYKSEPLPCLKTRHRDYASWLQKGKEHTAGMSYETPGQEEFENEILNLPTDYVRPAVPTYEGRAIAFSLDNDITRAIYDLSLRQNVTFYMIILAACNILFAKLSGQETIAIGSPIAGRTHVDLENVLGLFLNILCLKNRPADEKRFSKFLTEVKESTINAFESQEYLYDELLKKTKQARSAGRNPLFDVMLVLQNMEMPGIEIPGLQVTRDVGEQYTSKFDMTLYYEEYFSSFRLEYSTALFKPETIQRFIGYFKKVVEQILENPHQTIGGIEMISREEKQRILYDFNDTAVEYPYDRCIYQLITNQVRRTPDSLAAVQFNPDESSGLPFTLTYRELEAKSNRLARLLRKRGIKANTVAGIMMKRSLGMLLGILGILKAGGAYLPVDSQYPENRITNMLENSRASFLLTDRAIVEEKSLPFPAQQREVEIILVDELAGESEKEPGTYLKPLSSPNDLIYIIFTSGSTGIPKGAGVYHRGFVNLLHWFVTEFGFNHYDRNLLLTSLSFDLTQKNFYASLITGGQFYIPGFSYFEPRSLVKLIQENRITWINCTPSMFYKLVEYKTMNEDKQLSSLRYVFLGGEPISISNIIDWLESGDCHAEIVNTYGPTECTDISNFYRIKQPRRFLEEAVPIGQPVYNVQLYVPGKNLQILPVGIAGELLIGGAGVGIGYINDEKLTGQKFIKHSFDPNQPEQLLYRTGDLVKWLPDGNIEFLGRIDHQVKVRGFRIELGEIENQLLLHPAVKETLVMAREDEAGEKYLCAYIVPYSTEPAALNTTELHEYLSGELPDYMVPAYFMVLEKMPLNPNGKVDRKALPGPDLISKNNYVPPQNDTESRLAEIWSEVLGLDKKQVGIHDNFFLSGGHSLKATTLIGKIHKAFSVEIPIAEIFKLPTIKNISRYIEQSKESLYLSIAPVEKKEYYPLSSAQKRIFVIEHLNPGNVTYNIPGVSILEGKLNRSRFAESFKKLIARHESLRTSFQLISGEPVQEVHDDVEFEIEYDQTLVNGHWSLVNCQARGEVSSPIKAEEGDTKGTGGLAPLPGEAAVPNSQSASALISSFIRPFDLSRAPLLRVGLLELPHTLSTHRGHPTGTLPTPSAPRSHPSQEGKEDKHLLMIDMHHIISDGISMQIFIKEFTALYKGEVIPGLRIQYKDFSQWQNALIDSGAIKHQESYWLKYFEGEIPVLTLPYDFPRPARQTHEGSSLVFEITPGQTQQLKQLSLESETTTFIILLAIFNLLLSRLSGQEDIVVGSPTTGRRHPDQESLIGIFINTLALRNYPAADKTFHEFLAEVKKNSLDAYENQDYQYEELVEKIQPQRDLSRSPLFDVMLAVPNMEKEYPDIPGTVLKHVDCPQRTSKFDMTITAVEKDHQLDFTFTYSTALFTEKTIHRFINYFKRILAAVLKDIHQKITRIDILDDDEKKQLLYDFNPTEKNHSMDKTLHRLFEEQVKLTPHRIAALIEDNKITYRELNKRADQLAQVLRSKGIKTDGIVPVILNRSLEMIVSIMGILKAGGAYLPIDPIYPKERIKFIVADSDARIVISTAELFKEDPDTKIGRGGTGKNHEVICLNSPYFTGSHLHTSSHPRILDSRPDDLAYVIYTSGSAGKPKGVMVSHRSVINLFYALKNRIYNYDQPVNTALVSPFVFDASIKQVFPALLAGHRLIIVPGKARFDGQKLLKYYKEKDVLVSDSTPMHLNILMNYKSELLDNFPVKKIVVGGEALELQTVKQFLEIINKENFQVINVYGPTECCDVSSLYAVPKETLKKIRRIPIGKPLNNVKLYILGRNKELRARGVPGELHISGDGVARGYLNNPVLTAEKFCLRRPGGKLFEGTRGLAPLLLVPEGTGKGYDKDYIPPCIHASSQYHSPLPHYPLYSTGDLARWLEDGNIEFLGRIDTQVKIRGYRIESGEIENRLLTHETVKEAVVIPRQHPSADKYLCAYIVLKNPGSINIPVLKEFLAVELPDYMIPSFFVELEHIPLTPNGKLNRKLLPEPDTGTLTAYYAAPRDPVEKSLAAVWREILEVDRIGIDDHFFQLGGHSLKAIILISRMNKVLRVDVPLAEIFASPTIRGLSAYIKNKKEVLFTPIEPVEEKEYHALSSAQKRLYILQQMDEGSTGYNMPYALRLEGEVNKNELEEISRGLIARHESLRTSFLVSDGVPVQRIHHDVEFEIEYHDMKDVEAEVEVKVKVEEERSSRLEGTRGLAPWFIKELIRPFDLSQAPLLRVGLIKEIDQKHILMLDMHHIISDGISRRVLIDEFMALAAGKDLPPLRLQYKDFSAWQNSETQRDAQTRQKNYWKNQLDGEIPVLDLPVDYPRPTIQRFEGSTAAFELNQEEKSALQSLALTEGMTLYMILLAIYYILLAKLSNQEDILVATPTVGRRHADLQQIIGIFVNTLVLRNYPNADKTYRGFLKEIKKRSLQAFENQDYPYEELVEELVTTRDPGHNPLFDTMFVMQNLGIPTIKIPGLELTPAEHQVETSKFDITLIAMEVEKKLLLSFEYSSSLFKKDTIEKFVTYLKKIVAATAANPDVKIRDVEILGEKEKKEIIYDFNDTTADYPRDKTIHGLFESQVEKTPDHIAVVGPRQVKNRADMTDMTYISYRELNDGTNRLAHLLQNKNVKADGIVGIMMERSIEMIIGILGILKANGAYLPIDPAYPKERINYMLTDSNAQVLVVDDTSYASWLSFAPKVLLNLSEGHHLNFPASRLPGFPASLPSSLAYVIYTSGSTGRPKGVPVQHGSVVNILWALFKKYPLLKEDTYLLKTTYTFDVSVSELFGWYLGGGRLAILEPGGEKDPLTIRDWVQRTYVTHINFVPSMFGVFLEVLDTRGLSQLSHLQYIFLAGETLLPHLVTRFNRHKTGIKLENIYGPTEATIYASQYSLSSWRGTGSIPIGKPVNNTRLYIISAGNQPQPIGLRGELCIGGAGLARGYLNRPGLTAEKFDHDLWNYQDGYHRSYPSHKSYIIYRTGDLARWREDGNIEFLGRVDHQVKIRGFRIEPGEIENRLLKHNKVREAVVLAGEDEKEDKYLCAYIVPDRSSPGEAFDINALRNDLLTFLPGYMIPAYFVELEQTPLTPTGKINKNALPKPVINPDSEYRAPGDEIERRLQGIWSEVLGIEKDKIGTRDNFFKLGGHSLKATIMISKIYREVHVKIPLGEVFRIPTIMGLARYIKSASPSVTGIIEPVERKEYYALSSAQKRLYILQQVEIDNTAYNMPEFYELPGEIDTAKLEQVFLKLIHSHESLRTSFHLVGNEPVQKIHDQVDFVMANERTREEGTVEDRVNKFIRPFELSQVPLIRVSLLEIHDRQNLLLIDMHHIVSDGISHNILVNDFQALYEEKALSPLRIQYKDFSEWQNSETERKKLRQQEVYWLNEFAGDIPLLDLPTDYNRPDRLGFKGHAFEFTIDKTLTGKITTQALGMNVTVMMFLLSIYNILLSKYALNEDIIVGTVTAGRQHADLDYIIGFFVNMLAIRTFPAQGKRFCDYLAEVREKAVKAYENQDYPFEELVKKLGIPQQSGRHPLANVVFAYRDETQPAGKNTIPGLKGVDLHPRDISHFDLMLQAANFHDSIVLSFEYSTLMFKTKTIERLSTLYRDILKQVLEDVQIKLEEITTGHEFVTVKSNVLQDSRHDFDF